MAEGEATPVVEAKRLVERDDEGMSQSYHEIFDTQVNLNYRQLIMNYNVIKLRIILIGLPWWGIKPLHNLHSPRRQHWKRSEWGHRDWNTS